MNGRGSGAIKLTRLEGGLFCGIGISVCFSNELREGGKTGFQNGREHAVYGNGWQLSVPRTVVGKGLSMKLY